jgi:hypothetical protein
VIALSLLAILLAGQAQTGATDWPSYGRDPGGSRYCGSVVTGGGLVFIAAAMDNFLRAFDVETGRELAKWELPAGGQATPMTYRRGGKQFVVICAGGHGKMGTKIGDFVIALALPPRSLEATHATNRGCRHFIRVTVSRRGTQKVPLLVAAPNPLINSSA